MPKRIAVLECDTPMPDIIAKYGTYGDIFRHLLSQGDIGIAELEISTWDVVAGFEFPGLADMDAILLSGSKYNAFDDEPWIVRLVEFVQQALASDRICVLGVCFGHQIIARALGQKVGRNEAGWELAVDKVTLTDEGRSLFGSDSLLLHQMHRDIVYGVPHGITVLGYSDRCAIQGFHRPGRLLSLQAHPEFNSDIMSTILDTRYQQKILTEEQYRDASARASIEHDGTRVADVMMRMVLGT